MLQLVSLFEPLLLSLGARAFDEYHAGLMGPTIPLYITNKDYILTLSGASRIVVATWFIHFHLPNSHTLL
jgi:hypothetical protein